MMYFGLDEDVDCVWFGNKALKEEMYRNNNPDPPGQQEKASRGLLTQVNISCPLVHSIGRNGVRPLV